MTARPIGTTFFHREGAKQEAYPLALLVGTVGLLAAVVSSLCIGATWVAPVDVLAALTGQATPHAAVVEARVGRTIVGLVVGAAVALSGAAMQSLTRNPLADPGLTGINAGAALAIVVGIVTGTAAGQLGYLVLALVGGSCAALLWYGVAALTRGGASPITLALTGAAVTAGCTSVTSGLLMGNQRALDMFRFWQVGSVGGRDLSVLPPTLPLLLVGGLLTLACSRALDALALGDDLAAALGRRVWLIRLLVAGGAVMLAAAATSIAGPIAFIGLVVPHLARGLAGRGAMRSGTVSAVLGAALLLLADVLGRVVAPPGEVSAGILTAVLGVPALAVLLRRGTVTL